MTNCWAWTGEAQICSPSDGIVTLFNAAKANFTRLQFGGTTASFPAIRRTTTALNFRLADDSADAPITAAAGTYSGIQTISVNGASLVLGDGTLANVDISLAGGRGLTGYGAGNAILQGGLAHGAQLLSNNNTFGSGFAALLDSTVGNFTLAQGSYVGPAYGTSTNCLSVASPAVCAAASAGASVVAAAATTQIVNTTAVTANSEITITGDASLSTRLGVTCNTQSSLTLGTPRVSARVTGTSFTVILDVAPTTNPVCFNYSIVN